MLGYSQFHKSINGIKVVSDGISTIQNGEAIFNNVTSTNGNFQTLDVDETATFSTINQTTGSTTLLNVNCGTITQTGEGTNLLKATDISGNITQLNGSTILKNVACENIDISGSASVSDNVTCSNLYNKQNLDLKVGTTSNYNLSLIQNNIPRILFGTAGKTTFYNESIFNNNVNVNNNITCLNLYNKPFQALNVGTTSNNTFNLIQNNTPRLSFTIGNTMITRCDAIFEKNITQNNTAIITQSGTGVNIFKDSIMSSLILNGNLNQITGTSTLNSVTQNNTAVIIQTGTGVNSLKETTISKLNINGNIEQLGTGTLSAKFKDVECDNLTLRENKSILQTGTTDNNLGKTTMSELIVLESMTFPASVQIPAATQTDDLTFTQGAKIIQDTSDTLGNNVFVHSSFTKIIANGNIVQNSGTTQLLDTEIENLTITENLTMSGNNAAAYLKNVEIDNDLDVSGNTNVKGLSCSSLQLNYTTGQSISNDEFKTLEGSNTNTTIQTQLDNINNNIVIINGNIDNIESSITTINNNIDNIESSITTINNDIDNIESSITTINNNIDNIESSITTINNDITNLENNVVYISGNQTISGDKTFSGNTIVDNLTLNFTGGTISNDEFKTLNGINTNITIQEQLNELSVSTGNLSDNVVYATGNIAQNVTGEKTFTDLLTTSDVDINGNLSVTNSNIWVKSNNTEIRSNSSDNQFVNFYGSSSNNTALSLRIVTGASARYLWRVTRDATVTTSSNTIMTFRNRNSNNTEVDFNLSGDSVSFGQSTFSVGGTSTFNNNVTCQTNITTNTLTVNNKILNNLSIGGNLVCESNMTVNNDISANNLNVNDNITTNTLNVNDIITTNTLTVNNDINVSNNITTLNLYNKAFQPLNIGTVGNNTFNLVHNNTPKITLSSSGGGTMITKCDAIFEYNVNVNDNLNVNNDITTNNINVGNNITTLNLYNKPFQPLSIGTIGNNTFNFVHDGIPKAAFDAAGFFRVFTDAFLNNVTCQTNLTCQNNITTNTLNVNDNITTNNLTVNGDLIVDGMNIKEEIDALELSISTGVINANTLNIDTINADTINANTLNVDTLNISGLVNSNTIQTAYNTIISQSFPKTLMTNETWVEVASIVLSPFQKQAITFTSPISVYRNGFSGTFEVTEHLSEFLQCQIYKNGVYFHTVSVNYNNNIPTSKSFSRTLPQGFYVYEQYFTNITISFIPSKNEETNTTYTIYFNFEFSTVSPPSTQIFGYYANTNVSSQNLGNVIANSPSGIGYSSSSFTPNYNGIVINQTGTLYTNDLLTNRFKITQYTISNYDSTWFAVSGNSTYNLTHNFNWSFPNPPSIRAFFSTVSNPVLGTTPIYELDTTAITGLHNNDNNAMFGIAHINHTSSNTIRISTGINGVFYSRGGESVAQQITGFYRVIMYR